MLLHVSTLANSVTPASRMWFPTSVISRVGIQRKVEAVDRRQQNLRFMTERCMTNWTASKHLLHQCGCHKHCGVARTVMLVWLLLAWDVAGHGCINRHIIRRNTVWLLRPIKAHACEQLLSMAEETTCMAHIRRMSRYVNVLLVINALASSKAPTGPMSLPETVTRGLEMRQT